MAGVQCSDDRGGYETERKICAFLGPYEPLIMKVQSLLVWEHPSRSIIVFVLAHLLFWFIATTSMRFFFLVSVCSMVAVFIDTWKNKIWPEIRVPPPVPEDKDGWTPIHPRLLSVPELSAHLGHMADMGVSMFGALRRCRTSHPLVFVVGNTIFFAFLAVIGHYISGLMLVYLLAISSMLLPSMLYHSVLRKVGEAVKRRFTWLTWEKVGGWAGYLCDRLHIPRAKLAEIFRSVQRNPEVEEEDFVPQVNPEVVAALAKAINDSEDEGGNSSIPTPGLSLDPSLSNSDDERQDEDFDLDNNTMPSFDDLDNTDDEMENIPMKTSRAENFGLQTALQFATAHFSAETESEDEHTLADELDLLQTGDTSPNSSGHHAGSMGSLVTKTISTMVESAMAGMTSLGQGQSATSSSMIPRTGAKITYTCTEDGESLTFQNPEPTIIESEEESSDEDAEVHDVEEHDDDDDDDDNNENGDIAEIEKDFDFLNDLPENDSDRL